LPLTFLNNAAGLGNFNFESTDLYGKIVVLKLKRTGFARFIVNIQDCIIKPENF